MLLGEQQGLRFFLMCHFRSFENERSPDVRYIHGATASKLPSARTRSLT